MRADVEPDGLSPDDVHRARRAVARALESGLHSTDTPYVIDEDTFGVLLPEAGEEKARRVAGSLAAEAGHATFTDRSGGGSRRRAVREVAGFDLNVHEVMGAGAADRARQADELLSASRNELSPAPGGGAGPERA